MLAESQNCIPQWYRQSYHEIYARKAKIDLINKWVGSIVGRQPVGMVAGALDILVPTLKFEAKHHNECNIEISKHADE